MEGIAHSRSGIAASSPSRGRRGRLVRRVILFQVKLMADGIRDVVMSPLSIAAGLLGLVSRDGSAEIYFDRLMRFGRETDHWINLFDHRSQANDTPSLDRIAEQIEEALRLDYESGGLSARSAKALAEAAARLRDKAGR
ncbi:hypothetical protein ACFPOD_02110 [Nitratireductor kimnyeongensis]|uniref:Uncharacterized protein n=1 Tax=Nitratireductor kimnyeongensis TaxID=430679 RepID=A0ABW0T5N6_9HYPH|nr:hypothetical protein [Nitratireductor kimnyeongensis]QZZ35082.1 hypothetical protein KW403_15080 [Nitratireductor kimnyeongensis]